MLSHFYYSLLILFVKKLNSSIRLYINYRRLNSLSKRDVYLLPLINKTIIRLSKNKWFSKLDIRQAFYKLRIKTEEDKDLITFTTRISNYKYKVLPFRLNRGPASFQRFINNSFINMIRTFLSIYLNDLLIASATKEEHTQQIKQVLERLRSIRL